MYNVLELLEATASAHPEKTAVAYRDDRYTFAALRDPAQRLAPVIASIGSLQPVAVFCDRSADPAVLFLAVL